MDFDVLSVESSYRHLPLGQMKKCSLDRYLWSVCQESDVADVEDHRLMSQLGCESVGVPATPELSALGNRRNGSARETVWMCVSWRAHSFFQPVFKDLLCMCRGFILGAEDTVLSKVDKKLSPSSSEVAFHQLRRSLPSVILGKSLGLAQPRAHHRASGVLNEVMHANLLTGCLARRLHPINGGAIVCKVTHGGDHHPKFGESLGGLPGRSDLYAEI